MLQTQPLIDMLASVKKITVPLAGPISQKQISQFLQAPMESPSFEIMEAGFVRLFLHTQHTDERESNAKETIWEIDGRHLQHPADFGSGPIRSGHR